MKVGDPIKAAAFTNGQRVRYRPGTGTYGYEDDVEGDGRVPGIVRGVTPSGRVQVAFTLRPSRQITRAVDPDSLVGQP